MRFYNQRVATRHSRKLERLATKATQQAAMAKLRGLFGDKQPDPAEQPINNTPDERDYSAWNQKRRMRNITKCLSGRRY